MKWTQFLLLRRAYALNFCLKQSQQCDIANAHTSAFYYVSWLITNDKSEGIQMKIDLSTLDDARPPNDALLNYCISAGHYCFRRPVVLWLCHGGKKKDFDPIYVYIYVVCMYIHIGICPKRKFNFRRAFPLFPKRARAGARVPWTISGSGIGNFTKVNWCDNATPFYTDRKSVFRISFVNTATALPLGNWK